MSNNKSVECNLGGTAAESQPRASAGKAFITALEDLRYAQDVVTNRNRFLPATQTLALHEITNVGDQLDGYLWTSQ